MRFGNLTYLEIKKLAEDDALAIMPTGCTEQQGPHLPVDFDTWFAETVCLAAARQAKQIYSIKAVVLPTLPFGPTPEHRNYGAGYVDFPQQLHESAVRAICDSLVEQGFRRIVIWRGCGQHNLSEVAENFNDAQSGKAIVFIPLRPYHSAWCRVGDPEIPGGHADTFATAISLYLRPESVRVDQINNPKSGIPEWDEPSLDFTQYSSTGVIGDPTYASIELGARLWRAVVDEMAVIFKELAEVQYDPTHL